MPDALVIKEQVVSILRRRGPSLPVHVGRETQQSMLFASAFLSELISDKRVKVSSMKIGGSPLYFLPGQEPNLERFGLEHLKSREKDAFILLKDNKFLKDKDQEPAIRVALRALKDFAFPFQNNGEIVWRYFTVPESDFQSSLELPRTIENPIQPVQETTERVLEKPAEIVEIKEVSRIEENSKSQIVEEIKENIETIRKEFKDIQRETKTPIPNKELNIFDKKERSDKKSKPKVQKKTKPKPKAKKDDKFFNKVKDFLSKNSFELLDIESFSKEEIILRIKDKEEKLLIAYNKRKITEKEILKAHKKSLELGLPYKIVSLGETPKKIESLLNALKDLEKIERIE